MTILNDDSRVVNKLEASLTDDAGVVIYDQYMFIVQATGRKAWRPNILSRNKVIKKIDVATAVQPLKHGHLS